ncbi:hypothetical protein ACFL5V_01890 [Fibrobacterota bacterium]
MPFKKRIQEEILSVKGVDYTAIDTLKILGPGDVWDDFLIALSPDFAVKWAMCNRDWFGMETLEIFRALYERIIYSIELSNPHNGSNHTCRLRQDEYVFSIHVSRTELFVHFDKSALKNSLIDYNYLELVCQTIGYDFNSPRYEVFVNNRNVFSFSFMWSEEDVREQLIESFISEA